MVSGWIVFAVIGGLASNAFSFINRHALRDAKDGIAFGWYFEAIRLVLFGALALFDFRLVTTPQSFATLTALGLNELVAIYLFVKMHAVTHLSISVVINQVRLVWVAVIAFLFLGEALKSVEYLAIFIIFLGLTIVAVPKKLAFDRGVRLSFIFSIFAALDLILIKASTPYASIPMIMVFFSLPAALLLPFLMKDGKKRIMQSVTSKLKHKLASNSFNVVAMYAFTVALMFGETSKVTALYHSMMIVGVVAGIIFLKEREHVGRKVLGSLIVVAGVGLLTLF